ncbi:magnesium and cobalt transport protein CorA [Candidatus Nitrotoga fabula]|nr:magnesium and cobalt transport protein CorA [Candidatus Nitrotoga fabula]
MMIHAYGLSNGSLNKIYLDETIGRNPDFPVWIDIVAPNDEEREWIKRTYNLSLPRPEHLRDIEASARFYKENDEVHLRSDFLLGKESRSRSVTVAFVLFANILFSVHEEDLPVFYQMRMVNHGVSDLTDCKDVLIDLYSMDVEISADALEEVYGELGEVSSKVLNSRLSNKHAASVLVSIAHAEHLNGRIRRNLMDTRRAISFLMRSKLFTLTQLKDVRQIIRDIDSLDGHTSFLFDKINFLMDATISFINVNQNKVVRLFSVASVALLPPVLIASIYGMNFKHVPEFSWELGYPFALLLMLLSSAVPFWVFYKKNWLK